MVTKFNVQCPTCNTNVESTTGENDQNFQKMLDLFGVTRSGKPNVQCNGCFEKERPFEREQIQRNIEINCMFCDM